MINDILINFVEPGGRLMLLEYDLTFHASTSPPPATVEQLKEYVVAARTGSSIIDRMNALFSYALMCNNRVLGSVSPLTPLTDLRSVIIHLGCPTESRIYLMHRHFLWYPAMYIEHPLVSCAKSKSVKMACLFLSLRSLRTIT
jgi:hypothetical protein